MGNQSDIARPPYKYFMFYWLHDQNRLYSDPQFFGTDDRDEFRKAVRNAYDNGYEIDYNTPV